MAKQEVEKRKSVLIVGGGAGGMAAAIAAARLGADVTILEKEDKPGRKLLATGNGRCNLTNVDGTDKAYHGRERAFAENVLEGFSVQETRAFFRELGLYTTVENGRVYPYAGQAETVLHVLLRELSRLGVRIKCGEDVLAASKLKNDPFFHIQTRTWEYTANALVLACGTAASLGKKQLPANGYSLAASFGHSLVPTVPALVPLKVAEAGKLAFAGVRIPGRVTVFADGAELAADTGQLQLTENGISGIPVFNTSGLAARALLAGKKVTAELDFLPQLGEEETAGLLRELGGGSGCLLDARETLRGLLPERLVRSIFRSFAGYEPSIEELAERIKHFPLTVTGTAGEGHAQVLSGGVPTSEVAADTLESRLVPGLFLVGEMLDIDGICGGYNLQFAWSTGILAGRAAAMENYLEGGCKR